MTQVFADFALEKDAIKGLGVFFYFLENLFRSLDAYMNFRRNIMQIRETEKKRGISLGNSWEFWETEKMEFFVNDDENVGADFGDIEKFHFWIGK